MAAVLLTEPSLFRVLVLSSRAFIAAAERLLAVLMEPTMAFRNLSFSSVKKPKTVSANDRKLKRFHSKTKGIQQDLWRVHRGADSTKAIDCIKRRMTGINFILMSRVGQTRLCWKQNTWKSQFYNSIENFTDIDFGEELNKRTVFIHKSCRNLVDNNGQQQWHGCSSVSDFHSLVDVIFRTRSIDSKPTEQSF